MKKSLLAVFLVLGFLGTPFLASAEVVSALNISTCITAPGTTCAVGTSWSGAPDGYVEIYDTSTITALGYPQVGSSRQYVGYGGCRDFSQVGQAPDLSVTTGSCSFNLKGGTYKAELWGTVGGKEQLLMWKRFTVTDGSVSSDLLQNTSACGPIKTGLHIDDNGSTPDQNVANLQQFLSNYPQFYPGAQVTGHFGPQTQAAVQAYQSARGIVSSGAWDTTGYGTVGPKTLAAISADCASLSSTGSNNTTTNQPSTTTSGTTNQSSNTGAAAVTASLTINGGVAASIVVGDQANYVWSSTGAVSAASTYTVDSTGCGLTSTGPFPWVANTLQGSNSNPQTDCQGGHSYVVTYTATSATGATASASVTVRVVSNCSITFNGFCVPGSPLLPKGSQTSTVTMANTTDQTQTCPTGQTGTPPNCATTTNTNTGTLTPSGKIKATRVACLNNTSCYVAVDWAVTDSVRNGAPISDLGIVTTSNNAPVGGSWVAGKSYLITNTPQSSVTFNVPPGNYALYLWGWNAADAQVEVDRKLITVKGTETLAEATADITDQTQSQACPTGQTGTPPNCVTPAPTPTASTATSNTPATAASTVSTAPAGTLSANGCTATTAGGTCNVSVSWTTKNSFYSGTTPLAAINVVDQATNTFPPGITTYQDTTSANGSKSFSLKKGTYTVVLYGWYQGAYKLLQQQTVTVANPTTPAPATGGAEGGGGAAAIKGVGTTFVKVLHLFGF